MKEGLIGWTGVFNFGSERRKIDGSFPQSILTKRKRFTIIKIAAVLLSLRKFRSNLQKIVSKGETLVILVPGSSPRVLGKLIEVKQLKPDKMFFLGYKWVGGLLTNFRIVRNNIERGLSEVQDVKKINKVAFRTYRGLTHLRYFPQNLLTIGDNKVNFAIKEAYRSEINVISTRNTDCKFLKEITLPVTLNHSDERVQIMLLDWLINILKVNYEGTSKAL